MIEICGNRKEGIDASSGRADGHVLPDMPTGPEAEDRTADLIARILESRDIQFTIDNVAVRKFPRAYTFGPHSHRFIELDLIEEGGCGMLFGTELVRLGVNDCLLIYPDVSHYFFTRERSSCTIVQLEFAMENLAGTRLRDTSFAFLDELRLPTRAFLKLLPHESLNTCIRNIRHESQYPERGREEMLRLLFAQLLILLSREVEGFYAGTNAEPEPAGVARELALALANEYGEPIAIEERAAEMGVSSRFLRRSFNRAYGMSPTDFLQGLRLRKAASLLSQGRLSILEVALQSGFSSSQYFARVFKKEMGLTPGAFRAILEKASTDTLPDEPRRGSRESFRTPWTP